MKRNMRRMAVVFFTVAAITLSAMPARADTALTYDDTLKDIQQTLNRPCVIGAPSCPNTFPHTQVPGGPGNQDLTSPNYTVGQLIAQVGSSVMALLIDVNQSGGGPSDPIALQLVEVFVNNVRQFNFIGPQNVPLFGSLQGNGYSDAGLRGINFSGFQSTDVVRFHIVWTNQTDGQETFFLAAVPEPSSLLLLGLGLVGLGLCARQSRMRRFLTRS